MARKKRSCVATIALLIVLAVVGLEVAGRMLLSGEFRARAEEEVLAEWPGAFDLGPVSFSVLAGGTATYRDIVLYSPEVPDKPLLIVPSLKINVDLTRFLRGENIVEEVVAEDPLVDVERLEDTTIARMLRRLPGLLPERVPGGGPVRSGTAWAQEAATATVVAVTESTAATESPVPPPAATRQVEFAIEDYERVVVRHAVIENATLRFTDHHGHADPVTAELTPVNFEAHDIVFPFEGDANPPARYQLRGTIPSSPPGDFAFAGEATLDPLAPTFTVEWDINGLEASWMDQFVPDDLEKTELRGGTLDIEGSAACDKAGHLTGEWAFQTTEFEFTIDEGLMEDNIAATRRNIQTLGRNFRITKIPIDCDLFDVTFEIQECFADHLRERMMEEFQEVAGSLEKGQEKMDNIREKFGLLMDKLYGGN